jgi:hypothetical protein
MFVVVKMKLVILQSELCFENQCVQLGSAGLTVMFKLMLCCYCQFNIILNADMYFVVNMCVLYVFS